MSALEAIAATLGAASFVALLVAVRRNWPPVSRAVLALLTSTALIFLLTQQAFALVLFGVNVLLVLGTWRLSRTRLWWVWILILIALLVISKLPWGGERRNDIRLGIALWLGFSYLVFRLIHITVDAHADRAGDITLAELMAYALHPASLVAGPIDRIQSSVAAQREQQASPEDFHQGLWRILVGAFVKFVIANPLYAFISVHDMARNPDRPIGVAWLWLLAYSFYLYADFASYTDIAIGFGRLAGLHCPELRPAYLYIAGTVLAGCTFLSTWLRTISFPSGAPLRTNRSSLPCISSAGIPCSDNGFGGPWHGLRRLSVWGV
jgi:D-alanyl-lipoteichoic acid acyltransferase DltB (MBOAT superfamily)